MSEDSNQEISENNGRKCRQYHCCNHGWLKVLATIAVIGLIIGMCCHHGHSHHEHYHNETNQMSTE